MTPRKGKTPFDRRLRAEVRRILLLLERTRQTRRRVRLLVGLEPRGPRRRPPAKPRRVRARR